MLALNKQSLALTYNRPHTNPSASSAGSSSERIGRALERCERSGANESEIIAQLVAVPRDEFQVQFVFFVGDQVG